MDDIISLIVIVVEFRFHDLSHDVVIAQRLHLYRTVGQFFICYVVTPIHINQTISQCLLEESVGISLVLKTDGCLCRCVLLIVEIAAVGRCTDGFITEIQWFSLSLHPSHIL